MIDYAKQKEIHLYQITGKEVPVMIHGKQICPAGHAREISGETGAGGALRRQLQKLGKLFHTAPAAISGDSGKVMDNCIAYHREQRGH